MKCVSLKEDLSNTSFWLLFCGCIWVFVCFFLYGNRVAIRIILVPDVQHKIQASFGLKEGTGVHHSLH